MAEGNSPNHENPSGLNAQSGTLGPVGNQTFDPRVVDNMHAGFDSTLSLDFYSKYKRYLNPSSEDSNPDFPPSQCFKKYTDKSMGIVVPAKLTRPPYSDIHMTVIPGLSEAAAGNRLEQVWDIYRTVTQLDSTKVSHLKGNNLTCNRLHHIITTYMIIGNY